MTSMTPVGTPVGVVDQYPGDEIPKNVAPTVELGVTGLRRVSGYVQEEFLPQLNGRKAVQIYREMSDNDAITGAMLHAITSLLRQIEWRVEAASNSPEDKQAAEFLEQCMDDMSHSWSDLIAEILTMVTYGWSWHEIVYKRRVGPWEKDPKRKSKYTDNKIGWRKIPIRSQETLYHWVFDDKGGIQAMVQIAPPQYISTVLPIDKCLLFRTTSIKNNPEGRSMLRNGYRSWYYKKRHEEAEAIGMERDLCGLPVAHIPSRLLNAKPGSDDAKLVTSFRKMIRNLRRDEQEGVLFPVSYDENGNEEYKLELLSTGGSRQFVPDPIIQRYEARQLMTILMDFLLVGHDSSGGSYALHTDKTGLFRTAINSITQSIADVFNRHAIPRLFSINAWKPNELPKIVPNDVDPPDLTQLSQFMLAMTQAGMQWFPDPELEKFLRDAARLPQLDEQTEMVREYQQRQQNVMDIAQQHLQAMQIDQQAQQGEMQTQQMQMGLHQTAMGLQSQDMQNQMTQQQMENPQQDQVAAAKAQAIQQSSQYDTQTAKYRAEQEKQKLKQADDKHKMSLKQAQQQFSSSQKQGEQSFKTNLRQGDSAHRTKLRQAEEAHRQKLRQAQEAARAKARQTPAAKDKKK